MPWKEFSIPHGSTVTTEIGETNSDLKAWNIGAELLFPEEYIDPGDIGWAWYNGY